MKLGIIELKKYLSGKSEKELKEEIIELFKISKEVKEYYAIKVLPDAEKELLERYKGIVRKEFFPERGNRFPSYSVLKKAISDFTKVSKDSVSLADLLLFYAEQGVEFTNTYGDIDETFYNNIARIYEKAVDIIIENNLQETFGERCKKVMKDCSDIGWGFGDFIVELYYSNFELDD
jgi:hypothetical protein